MCQRGDVMDERSKKEIEELTAKKNTLAANQGSGFWAKTKGFMANMGINRQINARQQYLGAKRQIAATKTQIQLREQQEKLRELNKKRNMTFEGLASESPKRISLKDLIGE